MQKHLNFLATVKLPFAEQQFEFQEMLKVITEAGQRLARYEKQIASVVEGWRWQPVAKVLMSLRGVALLTGPTLVAELGDWHRFATKPQRSRVRDCWPNTTNRAMSGWPGSKSGIQSARGASVWGCWCFVLPPVACGRTSSAITPAAACDKPTDSK